MSYKTIGRFECARCGKIAELPFYPQAQNPKARTPDGWYSEGDLHLCIVCTMDFNNFLAQKAHGQRKERLKSQHSESPLLP